MKRVLVTFVGTSLKDPKTQSTLCVSFKICVRLNPRREDCSSEILKVNNILLYHDSCIFSTNMVNFSIKFTKSKIVNTDDHIIFGRIYNYVSQILL